MKKQRRPRNPIPYVGGKAALAPKLVAMFPEHHTYVEVFGGVAHVLFRKERSRVEVYNDLNGRLGDLCQNLRDGRLELFYPPSDQHAARTLAGKFDDQRPSNTTRCTRNDRAHPADFSLGHTKIPRLR